MCFGLIFGGVVAPPPMYLGELFRPKDPACLGLMDVLLGILGEVPYLGDTLYFGEALADLDWPDGLAPPTDVTEEEEEAAVVVVLAATAVVAAVANAGEDPSSSLALLGI